MMGQLRNIIFFSVVIIFSIACSSNAPLSTNNEDTVKNCFITSATGICENGDTVTADGSGCNQDQFLSCNEASRDAHLDLEYACSNKGGLRSGSENLGSCDCETRGEC